MTYVTTPGRLARSALGLVLVLLAACTTTTGVPLSVTVTDDSIVLGSPTVEPGPYTFEAVNNGTVAHEFEVFSTQVGSTDLPIVADTADTRGLTLLDEVEDVLPGGRASLTIELAAGTYLIICNLPGHYANGMVTLLEVGEA